MEQVLLPSETACGTRVCQRTYLDYPCYLQGSVRKRHQFPFVLCNFCHSCRLVFLQLTDIFWYYLQRRWESIGSQRSFCEQNKVGLISNWELHDTTSPSNLVAWTQMILESFVLLLLFCFVLIFIHNWDFQKALENWLPKVKSLCQWT